jgi:hypothetical protein
LAQGKDFRVCRWIGLVDAFVKSPANDFPFNDNDCPYGDLIQLKGPLGLHQGFRHEDRVLQ